MDELTVTVEELDEDGRGVGAAAGLEVHVTGALPGERVVCRVEHESPHAPRAWASLVRVEGAPAPERVPPACPGHGRCGGCILQHLAYPAQLTEKRRRVERALAAHTATAELPVLDVVASPRELAYRNKAKYVVFARPGKTVGGSLGFGSYAPASHDVVDMAGCQVPEPPIDLVARAALHHAERERVPAYDERERRGELRYLVVRASSEGQALVVLVTRTHSPEPALRRAARALRAERPEVAGVHLNVNDTTGGAIFGAALGDDVLLDGQSALADDIAGIPFELSPRAFFQVNRLAAARLYQEVARAAGARPGLRVVDLYSGAGGIALTLARAGARVYAVESSPVAATDAARTAERLGLAAATHFETADAAHALPAARRFLGALDAVVVNPPRKGLGPAARAALAEAQPRRIVYVSCGPASLAADLAVLVARGWRVTRVLPFDLMPGTPHVETVVTLER